MTIETRGPETGTQVRRLGRTWLQMILIVIGLAHSTSLHLCEAAPPGIENAATFLDATEASGIQFVHNSPFTPDRHTHLAFGSGIGWIDFDQDDLPDLYAAQGVPFETKRSAGPESVSDCLYRNLGSGRFEDVSNVSGLNDADYSMGLAVGDFDNDGFQDIHVTNFGPNRLLSNNGDGTFTEIAAVSGVADAGFGASCTWVDLDDDGSLDLYVVNYVKLDLDNYELCTIERNGKRYGITCHPRVLLPTHDVLFRSHGDGRFSDETAQAGMEQSPAAQGLGVVAADLDADGDIDVYVANDSVANDLWINQGNGQLTNEGISSGTAFNRAGQREAGMGVVAGDVDGDGLPDLFVTNYYGETNTLYRNEAAGYFLDVTDEFGLGSSSRLKLGFGTSLFDFDNDGWLDLFVANGHVHDRPEILGQNETFAQRPQLFQNQAGQRFTDVSDSGGPYFQHHVVGRSSAVADYDRDGWQDLAVGHLNSSLVLLHNQASDTSVKSLQIQLVGVHGNRNAIGAVVEVRIGEKRPTRFRGGSSGYLSCDEGCLTIGVGTSESPVDVTVRWPGGTNQIFRSLQIGRRHVLIEGRQALQLADGNGLP
ncbi:MAG TPA: CRTAC1 family protein [Planctomycetaceae bacterium]|nr:CRTAC1 family protein [Planctomycetaceae bacterium]HQZ65681.1 CRTAC1 family protein [Planctomycetaceae bacterium]